MFFLPHLQLLNQFKELPVECDETLDHTNRVLHFLRLFRRKDYTDCRLRRAFEHMLAFLVKAGSDGVSVLEGNEQRWQRRPIVVAAFEGLRLFNAQTGESLHFPQTIDPAPVRTIAVRTEQAA